MKWLLQVILVVLTSFYIFPIEFRVLPSANTKMLMAVLGVMVFIINSIMKRENILPKKVVTVGLCALLVSFVGIISVLFNDTNDLAYASYFVSFLVWFFAAYFVVSCIKTVHGCISVRIVCNYLIAVALSQCVLAILIDQIPAFKNAANTVVVGFASMYSAGEGLERAGRLYGVGAALDVAGTRFCAILCMLGIMIYESYQLNKQIWRMLLYVLLFVILLVIGSMISRTTGIGLLFVIVYYITISRQSNISGGFWGIIIGSLLTLITIVIILYNTSPFFYENLRFAFEGFFNYFETGKWSLNSTDTLMQMYVYPESLKTWIIGDAYFDEPYVFDPYYVGEVHNKGLFYMGTDVGYLRFVFYFGIIGLSSFIIYFIVNMLQCVNDFPKNRWIFIALLMMNFMIWFKVATDIFCLFALFLCISKEDNDAYEKRYENSISDPLDI